MQKDLLQNLTSTYDKKKSPTTVYRGNIPQYIGNAGSISSEIKNKARMSTFALYIQSSIVILDIAIK